MTLTRFDSLLCSFCHFINTPYKATYLWSTSGPCVKYEKAPDYSEAHRSQADRARFELAEGCPSTVFKTVSLDRSDICPMLCTTAQSAIIAKHAEQSPERNTPPSQRTPGDHASRHQLARPGKPASMRGLPHHLLRLPTWWAR